MSFRDGLGILLVIVGVTLSPTGYKWLGAIWMWGGILDGGGDA